MKIDEQMTGIKTVGISGHVRPDGDCIGSCMGMYLYLKKNYPDARVDVFLEEIPPELEFIADIDKVNHDFSTDVKAYDLFICLDCGKERLGDAEKIFDVAIKKINIDHHVSNSGTGDLNYIVPSASSSCEKPAALRVSLNFSPKVILSSSCSKVLKIQIFNCFIPAFYSSY